MNKETLLPFADRTRTFVICLFLGELKCCCLSLHENYYYKFQKNTVKSLYYPSLC